MHPAGNETVTLQCCGSKVIHQEEECCNGIGYDPQRHVCADKPTPGLLIQGLSTHANRSHNTLKMADENLQLDGSLCASHEEVVYSGDANRYTYTDSVLEPFTTYEYRVRGWNSFGRGSSDVTTVSTSEDKPWGVAPPRWSRLGDITHYVILRDGQERYRGDETSFTDVGGIRPFQEFSYQLRRTY
ncbi:hypothetical protein F7725_026129 [Dissostichus mawsoni]|uniref:Fibronectin type-III domain-containing protein n=1 Tax=Dissostichus mawsoni TaxID=36200 RepID=A0A7J5X651_DISMA|nr:hypothetical protein F7725_026129 [Dissostichus mawsoni]